MPTPADQAAAAAATGFWVDQAAASAAGVTTAGMNAASGLWSTFGDWYEPGSIARQAAEVADLSATAQGSLAGLFSEYVGQVTAILRQTERITIPRVSAPSIRNGVDPIEVHSRPAAAYREAFAFTGDELVATQRAIERAARLLEDDAMLAARDAQMEAMEQAETTLFRRVLRPELSEQGPCGLCVVAADQKYTVRDLLPLHGRCKCITLPIYGEFDPGISLNRADLNAIYAAAGDSSKGADLKKLRVQVNEHGELGPVLTRRGQKFTGPDDLKPAKDPGQDAQDLKKLLGVLDTLMDRSKSGEDLDRPLAYQRARINRLQSTAA